MAISLAALYLALRGVALGELSTHLAQADYTWLLPSIAVIVAGQLARAARWQVLFGTGPRPRFSQSFWILSVGYLVSNVLPLRLGDPARAVLVEARTSAGGAEAFATVMVERAIDFLTILALMAIWVPVPASQLLRAEFGAGAWAQPTSLRAIALGLVVGVYAAWVVISMAGERAGRLAERTLLRLGLPESVAARVGRLVAGFAAGFAPLRSRRTAVAAVSWTVLVWLIGGLGYALVMRSFGLTLPFAAAVFALGATALFAVLPSSPGYIGVFHYAVRVALRIYSEGAGIQISDARALTYAIVLHGVTVVVLLALGLAAMWVLGLSTGELGRGLQRAGSVKDAEGNGGLDNGGGNPSQGGVAGSGGA